MLTYVGQNLEKIEGDTKQFHKALSQLATLVPTVLRLPEHYSLLLPILQGLAQYMALHVFA